MEDETPGHCSSPTAVILRGRFSNRRVFRRGGSGDIPESECHYYQRRNRTQKMALEKKVLERRTKSKVLGLLWDRSSDDIILITQAVFSYLSTQPSTKQTILHAFARLYDPLGYVAPFHVRARLLFQQLWRHGIDGDEPLLPDVEDLWKNWVSELPALSTFRIQRCISLASLNQGSTTIHFFADASPHAYRVAVFVRQ